MRTDRAIEIVTRLYDEGHINNREQGTLRRAILLPERPEGKWIIKNKSQYDEYADVECSNCNRLFECWDMNYRFYDYCPHCGARMSAAEDIKFGGF